MEVNQSEKLLPTVLVVGKNIGEALLLTKSIYSRSLTPNNEKSHDSLCRKALDIKVEAPFISEQYEINTNYYSSDIRIACLTYDYLLPLLDSKDLDETLGKHAISSVEGVIFVSNFKSSMREGLDQYLKYHKEIIDAFSPELTMTFANSPPNKGEELFEIFQFGENEMFVEVIDDDLDEIKPLRPDPSVPKPKFEDKYGVDRITENFECHMWPNMNKKEVKKRAVEPSEEKEDAEEESELVKETPVEKKDVPVVVETEKEKKVVQEKSDKQGDVKNAADEEKNKKEGEALIQQLSKNIGNMGVKPGNDDLENENDGEDLDSLSKIFETIQQFKMSSKNLTDDERKKKAADLITQLVSNCKDLQDDGEDDDDDDDSDT